MADALQLIGRSSSHYTRVAAIFAHQFGVTYELVPVHEMKSLDPLIFAGNPALKVPSLRRGDEMVFGSQNVCRCIWEIAGSPAGVVWPEQVTSWLGRAAHEMVSHCMQAQVTLVLGIKVNGLPEDNAYFVKVRTGFEGALAWLEQHFDDVIALLPPQRTLSLFEVELFCLIEHLAFRGFFTLSASAHPRLSAFARDFATQPSASATPYRFDASP